MASRSLPRRFLVNTASIFGGETFARLATALMAFVVARFYGLEALGNYGYALAVASILLIVPDFGLHLFVMREFASWKGTSPKVFCSVHWLKLGLSVFVLIFALCFGEWGIAVRERRILLYLLVLRVLLQTFSQSAMAIFKALERMQFVALQQFVNAMVVSIWVGACLVLHVQLPVLIAGFAVAQLAETVLGWILLLKVLPTQGGLVWDRRLLARIAAASFPFGVTAILLALNLRLDVFVLSHYASARILGQFNAAAWFVTAMFLSASLFMSVLFPKLSRLLSENSTTGSDYVRSLVKNALVAAGIGSLVLWILAPRLILLLFGPDFLPAAYVLRVLSPALPLVFLNTIFFYVFAAARRRFVCLVTLVVGLLSGIFLTSYLTAHYGAAGTASGDVARELAMSVVYLGFLIQGNHSRFAGVVLLKVFVGATAVLAITMVLAEPFHFRIMWVAAWMFFVLTGAVAVLGLPNVREWRLLTDDRL